MIADEKKKKPVGERVAPVVAIPARPEAEKDDFEKWQDSVKGSAVNNPDSVSAYYEKRTKEPVGNAGKYNTNGWREQAEYSVGDGGYTPSAFSYQDSPFIKMFTPPPAPELDKDREKRLQRQARVNALGDFVTQLGTLAGGGHAPVRKYEESKYLTKANAEIDRLQQVYEADKRRYGVEKRAHDNNIVGMRMQDYGRQLDSHAGSESERRKAAQDLALHIADKDYDSEIQYKKAGLTWDMGDGNNQAARERAWINLNKGKENKPFTEVQFKNSALKIDATEGQVRKSIADLKDKYESTLSKNKESMTPKERKLADDIAMIEVSMESGQNKDAVKDVFARYLEENWNDLKYIFPGQSNMKTKIEW